MTKTRGDRCAHRPEEEVMRSGSQALNLLAVIPNVASFMLIIIMFITIITFMELTTWTACPVIPES